MSTIIPGRLIRCGIKKTTFSYLEKEQSSSLSISRLYVAGAGSSSRDSKNYPGKKTWSISSSMLFSLDDIEFFLSLIERANITEVSYSSDNGAIYQGKAFPTRLSIQDSVGSLIKCQVQWQGTGPLAIN